MKNKKGFTLIELLAVIVLLAIITVIAVPKILDVIEKSERNAYENSVNLMVHQAQIQYETNEVIGKENTIIPEEGIVYEFGINDKKETYQINIEEVGELKFKGDKPSSGTITLTKDKRVIVQNLVSKNGKWCAKKDANSKNVTVGKTKELGCTIEEDKTEEIVEDQKPCELETETKDGKTYYYVDSVCDLYALSKNVSSGTNYSGKIVKLRNNLDMSKIDDNTQKYIEENGEFKPIGTSAKDFEGTFEGNAKTISKLTIEDSNSNDIGLFGYSSGTIKGLTLKNITVTGKDNVGGLVGTNKGIVQDIIIDGNIRGTNNVGGVVGKLYTNKASVSNIIVKNVMVDGPTYIGGLIGFTGNAGEIKNIIIEKGNIASGYAFTGDNSSFPQKTSMRSDFVTVANTNKDEVIFSSNAIGDINAYETYIDTYIGGDNDKSGYYFDYNSKGELVIKSTEKDPIEFKLTGSGTESDPYLVGSYDDWKMATTKVNAVFKLTNDIDFSGKKFYMLGSNTNKFTGHLIGDMHKLKNINMNGGYYQGIIGYMDNTAIVEGLNVEGFTIKNANDNIGAVVGYANKGTLKGINLDNISVNGTNNVGGIIGTEGNVQLTEATVNGSIAGINNVGGVIGNGNNSNASEKNIILNVNVSGTTKVGGVKGYSSSNTIKYIILESGSISGESSGESSINAFVGDGGSGECKYIGSKITEYGKSTQGGTSLSDDYINNLKEYKNLKDGNNVVIEVDEDTNKSGYVFGTVNNKIKVIKAN